MARDTSFQEEPGEFQELYLITKTMEISSLGENGWTLWHYTTLRSLSSLGSVPKTSGVSQLGSRNPSLHPSLVSRRDLARQLST